MICIDGQFWHFEYEMRAPDECSLDWELELTEVYRYEGAARVTYAGDYNEGILRDLATTALIAMDELREY